MEKIIHWGIIGCGDVTEVKSGPAFNKVGNSELVAVMRRNAEKAEDYARRHSVPRWYTSADELINDPAVNAIYVATPPDTHAEYAIRALKAGKPVYVEKPMALNFSQCQEMIQTSEQTGQPLFVAYYRRALPSFLKVRELVLEGVIGDIRSVNMVLHTALKPGESDGSKIKGWRVDPQISGGGHFHDLASHQFDYLLYLLGDIEKAQGIAVNQAGLYPADDNITASFKFKKGITGTGSWCFTVPDFLAADYTILTGTGGSIRFSFFADTRIEVQTENGKSILNLPHPPHVQQPLIEMVVNELLGKGKSPSTGKTAALTTRVLDEITR